MPSANKRSLACWRTDAAEFTNMSIINGECTTPQGTLKEGVNLSEAAEGTFTHCTVFVG